MYLSRFAVDNFKLSSESFRSLGVCATLFTGFEDIYARVLELEANLGSNIT